MASVAAENATQALTNYSILPILPPEVLQHILGEYDQSWESTSALRTGDLLRACCVSKSWQLMAERELYRRISVTCHEKMRTLGLREGKFRALERVCRALLLTNDAPRRRGYVQGITLRHLRCVNNIAKNHTFWLSRSILRHLFEC